MKAAKIKFETPVTLVGGGTLDKAMLDEARALAPGLVAADGAADRLDAWGLMPDAVIGDMDSIREPGIWSARTRLVQLDEQDTTDFEKCLYATEAPFYLAAGFTGRRVDHMLAVFNAMLRRPEKQVVLLGEEEAMVFLPPERKVAVQLPVGAVVSLFPLLAARGVHSEGLRWPVQGLAMGPGGQVGTSNEAVAERVVVAFDGPGVLLLVARRHLAQLVLAAMS